MTLAQPLYSVTAEVRMEIINLLLQGASILPAATIQPFLFLLQHAGAKRLVNDQRPQQPLLPPRRHRRQRAFIAQRKSVSSCKPTAPTFDSVLEQRDAKALQ
jgi:hypothetical protein